VLNPAPPAVLDVDGGLAAADRSILDALPAHIAVLDSRGVILSVNKAWRRFATESGMSCVDQGVGSNYLRICDGVTGSEAVDVRHISDGIRAVLHGTQEAFSGEYPCHSPSEERWFLLNVTAVAAGHDQGALVMHTDITPRKQAEQAMERTVERLNEAQRVARIGDWDFDIASGVISWSPLVYDILGREPELGPPRTYEENAALFEPESRKLQAENINRAIESGEPQEYELTTSAESGPPVHVQAVAVPVKDEAGIVRGIHGTVQDVTASRSAQSALKERERELRETQRLAQLGSWYHEFDDGLVRWSEETSRIFGLEPSVYEQSFDDLRRFFGPETFAEMGDMVGRLRDFGKAYEIEAPITRIDGSRGWTLARGEPVRNGEGTIIAVRGTVLDITERKLAEWAAEQLATRTAQRERMLSTLLSSMTDFAYVYDREGRFVFVNQPLLDLWGITLEAAIGRNFVEIGYPEELAKKLLREVNEVFETKESLTGETPYTSPSGVHGFYEYIFSPVIGADGTVENVVGSTRDVTERRRTEDQLRASDEQFRQFAANIDEVFWVRSADMSEVQFLSPAFERIWGRPMESLLSNPESWTEFIVAEDRERVAAIFADLCSEARSVDVEYRIARPDGEIRWVRARGFQVRDGNGVHIKNIGISSDITEKQLAAVALRASAEQFRALAEALKKSELHQRLQAEQLEMERSRLVAAQHVAKVGSWETDLSSMAVRWSEETHRIFGVEPERSPVTHSTFLDLVHPEDRLRVNGAFEESMRAGGPRTIEHRLLLADGMVKTVEERWEVVFDAQDNPLRAVGTCQDITERRQAEDALRQSQKRLRDVFDGLGPSMFVALLAADGILMEINRSPLEAAGLRPDDVLGLPFDQTHWWTYSAEVQHQLRDAMARARSGESSRYDVKTRGVGDEVIDMDFSLEPLRDDAGTIRFLVASATVITDRKIAEDALRQAQKMEAVGQLAAGVAHEFNNLLQALMSTSAILRYRAETPAIASTGTDLEMLIKRGAGLTHQLLLFARNSAIEKSSLDLGRELRTASAFLRPLIPETIAIVVDVPAEPLQVAADAGQLQQVLLNLAINARDAMPAGGTLTLRAGRAGDEVFQEVEDNGHGMSAETRAHLFEPFFSTKLPGKGTGLGLAVAHGIIEQHGGRFEVHSTPGEGSRFRVILPAALGSAEAVMSELSAGTSPSIGAGRVFLVEDDESVREGVATLLGLMGFEVVTAASGEEAIALTIEPPPQVLLSDVTLPGMTGPRVAALLRERWPELKIILMSGYFEETMRANASRQGCQFLPKPFELEELARVLALAMNEEGLSVTTSPHAD